MKQHMFLNDTDVVILAISNFARIGVDLLWFGFGAGKHFKYIPKHHIATSMSTEMCKALPALHSLTGCDTTSFSQGLARNQHMISGCQCQN